MPDPHVSWMAGQDLWLTRKRKHEQSWTELVMLLCDTGDPRNQTDREGPAVMGRAAQLELPHSALSSICPQSVWSHVVHSTGEPGGLTKRLSTTEDESQLWTQICTYSVSPAAPERLHQSDWWHPAKTCVKPPSALFLTSSQGWEEKGYGEPCILT